MLFVDSTCLCLTDSTADRQWNGCPRTSLSMAQSRIGSVYNGIPEFQVTILFDCEDCVISDLHINCGDFASAKLVIPTIFRRLSVGDCLVMDGKHFLSDQIIEFTYANSFLYPMSLSSYKSSCMRQQPQH